MARRGTDVVAYECRLFVFPSVSRSEDDAMVRSRVSQGVTILLAVACSLLEVSAVSAGFIVNPGTVFGGGGPFTNPSLTTLALTLYAPGTTNPIANTAFTATWYTPAGAVAGTTTITTNAA